MENWIINETAALDFVTAARVWAAGAGTAGAFFPLEFLRVVKDFPEVSESGAEIPALAKRAQIGVDATHKASCDWADELPAPRGADVVYDTASGLWSLVWRTRQRLELRPVGGGWAVTLWTPPDYAGQDDRWAAVQAALQQ